MDIVHDAVPQRINRAVHQGDAHLHVGLGGAEREGLEQEHGAADDAEVGAHGSVLEEIPRQQTLDDGSE